MSISVDKLFRKWDKEPEFRAEYEALDEEFSRASTLIAARTRAGLTQAQVAHRMGTTQPAVARLESGKRKPSYATLERYAKALGCSLRLELVPLERAARAG
jgi:transcriptional regulator with XRE-family HTH domain